MLIELCGPSGSGKTYLLNCFKGCVDGVVFPDTKINEITNPFSNANEKTNYYISNQNLENYNSDLDVF